MATTTNYGWTTPDDTALVKDGASAIRSLGTSVDTTTKNLNPSTTLGDIEYRSSTANTNTRLGVGTTGQILTVAAGVPSWATPAAGGALTSLASGSLAAGATGLDITSISAAYNELWLYINNLSVNATGIGNDNGITLNNNTSDYNETGTSGGSVVGSNSNGNFRLMACAQATGSFSVVLKLKNYSDTTSVKLVDWIANTNATTTVRAMAGMWANNAAVNRITLTLYAGAYDAGTYALYGVK